MGLFLYEIDWEYIKKALADARTELVTTRAVVALTGIRLVLLMRGYPLIIGSGFRILIFVAFIAFHSNISLHRYSVQGEREIFRRKTDKTNVKSVGSTDVDAYRILSLIFSLSNISAHAMKSILLSTDCVM